MTPHILNVLSTPNIPFTNIGAFNAVHTAKAARDMIKILLLVNIAVMPCFFAMTAYDSSLDESAFSNEVSKVVVAPTGPMPPVVLEDETVVFTVVKQPNRFLLLSVGTVPAGTVCDANNSTNGHWSVPVEAVVWTDPAGSRPIVVVAKCDG